MSKLFIDFVAVKAAITMEQVLDHYGLRPDMRNIRNGDGLEGACPIHQGTNKTQFKVSLSKNCWNCFSECKCGGNVLDFIAKMEKVEIYDAALKANEWFDLGLEQKAQRREERPAANASRREFAPPPATSSQSPPHKPPVSPPTTSSASPADDEPVEIGCNKPLGFKLENLKTDHPYFDERGLLPETVAEFGLGYCAKGTMASRVVIPIHNHVGELVGYVGRWPGIPPEERPKYKLPMGFKKSAEVFNLHRAIQGPPEQTLIVVEGFFDVMKLWQLGFKRAVSIMGSSLSAVQEELFRQATRSDSRIILMFDEDNAGRKGREQALLRLATFAFVHVVVFPAEDMQPDHLSVEELLTLLPQ